MTTLPFSLPNKPGFTAEFHDARPYPTWTIELPGASLVYIEGFLDVHSSDKLLDYLLRNNSNDWRKVEWRDYTDKQLLKVKFDTVRWQQRSYWFCDRPVTMPRLTAFQGDDGLSYTYSGVETYAEPWNPGLKQVALQLEKVCDAPFNSVLLNWYRDGEDYVSWHSDDEPELGARPVIASVSLGEARTFNLRHKVDRTLKASFNLKHGDLLVMQGDTQKNWQHTIPPRAKVKQSRINLTFRNLRNYTT